jgi:hypothetical protein
VLRYHILDIEYLFLALSMAEVEPGEIVQPQASKMPREAILKYSGKGLPKLDVFKANMLSHFNSYDVPASKQASCTLLNCENDIQARVYRQLGITGTVGAAPAVDISTITFEQAIAALKAASQHEAEGDKGICHKLSNVRASTFKGDSPSADCYHYMEGLRAQLERTL